MFSKVPTKKFRLFIICAELTISSLELLWYLTFDLVPTAVCRSQTFNCRGCCHFIMASKTFNNVSNSKIMWKTSIETIVEAAMISQRPVKDCTIFQICDMYQENSRTCWHSQWPVKHCTIFQYCDILQKTCIETILEAGAISQRSVKYCTIFQNCEILWHVSRKF